MPITQEQVRKEYNALYNLLDDAYWKATTIEAKDKIHGLADIISSILTTLTREELKKNTKSYNELKATVSNTNDKLTKLKDDIDNIIHKIDLAVKIAKGVDKVVKLAEGFFA